MKTKTLEHSIKKKNRITDFTSNYDSETNTPDVKKKNKKSSVRDRNLEGEANNKTLKKEDPHRSNLNSKYPSLALALNHDILILVFVFTDLNTSKDHLIKRTNVIYVLNKLTIDMQN